MEDDDEGSFKNEASEMTAVIKLLISSGEPIFIDFKLFFVVENC